MVLPSPLQPLQLPPCDSLQVREELGNAPAGQLPSITPNTAQLLVPHRQKRVGLGGERVNMWHHSVSWALRHGSFCCQIPSRCAKCVQTGMTVWRQFSAICQILASPAPSPQPGAPWLPERQIQTLKHGHLFRCERLHRTSGPAIRTRRNKTRPAALTNNHRLFMRQSYSDYRVKYIAFIFLRLVESKTSDNIHTPKIHHQEVTHSR